MSVEFLTLQTAMSDWLRYKENPEDQWDAYQASETFILTSAPRCVGDAGAILDVLITQLGDPRSDGLDQRALQRVRAFLSTLGS